MKIPIRAAQNKQRGRMRPAGRQFDMPVIYCLTQKQGFFDAILVIFVSFITIMNHSLALGWPEFNRLKFQLIWISIDYPSIDLAIFGIQLMLIQSLLIQYRNHFSGQISTTK